MNQVQSETRGALMNRQEALRKVIEAYKISKGIEKNTPRSKAWDRGNYARATREAKNVLEAFGADWEQQVLDPNVVSKAVFFLIAKGEEWDEAGFPDWTLAAVARHAWDNGLKFSEKVDKKAIGSESKKQLGKDTPLLENN